MKRLSTAIILPSRQTEVFPNSWCGIGLYRLRSGVLVELVPTFSPGLNVPRSHCYNTRQCTAAVTAMTLLIKLLLLGEGIVGKFNKRKRTDKHRQPDRRILTTPAPAATQRERDRQRQ